MRRLYAIVAFFSVLLVCSVFWPTPKVHAQLAASSGFAYLNVTSATNTQAKSASGILHNIVINGGTLTGTITVKDTSASDCSGGNAIATIAANQVAGQNYEYDLQAVNGICVTTAAAVNITVDYR